MPKSFGLNQNYPNPFNPETTIQFQLPKQEQVEIIVYNILGREVCKMTDSKYEPGYYSLVWDGKNNQGAQAATGIYLFRMHAGDFVKVRKMSLIR